MSEANLRALIRYRLEQADDAVHARTSCLTTIFYETL
jgi:hypothetical protein